MSKKPPNRPGITFEIGARLEALDYLQKWYGKYGAPEVKPSICNLHGLINCSFPDSGRNINFVHILNKHIYFFLVFLLFNRFCS